MKNAPFESGVVSSIEKIIIGKEKISNEKSVNQLTGDEGDNVEDRKQFYGSLSRKLQKTLIISDSSVFPIKFWGKVIDQYGHPVSDVNVLYYAAGGYIGGGSGFGRIKTDKEGLFNIKGVKGGSLNLREMEKDGYQIVIRPQDDLFYSYKQYPHSLIWSDYSEKNPFLYTAWKYGDDINKENLKKGRVGIYCKSGNECTINLFGPPTQNNKQDFINSQFKIQYFQEEVTSDINQVKWKLLITAIDGGVQKAGVYYTNEAPKEGYLNEIAYTQDDYIDGNHNSQVRNIYISIKDEMFARFSFKINLYSQEKNCSISARYTINTAGEPYLDSFDGW